MKRHRLMRCTRCSGIIPVPDNLVLTSARRPASAGAAAVMVADEPVRVARLPAEVRESYLEIFDRSGRRLVTGIEFLSPTNKLDRRGRQLYRRKQQTLRRRGIHLVEIDLLRRGRHLLELPEEVAAESRPWDYLVNVARRGGDGYEFYPLRLQGRLPRVGVPLRAGDSDAVLDLQAAFGRAFDVGAFADVIDYSLPPVPPLAADDAAWADRLLKEKGLR